MNDSVFTKIINGEIPCHKIYEDEHVLAFLDVYPVQPGHTLIVPKKQVEFVWDLDETTYNTVMMVTKKVALALRNAMGSKFVGEQIVGIDVPHAHVHLIPFNTVDEFRAGQDRTVEPDHATLATVAETIRKGLQ